MNLERVRELLPKNSYQRIAEELSISRGTVSLWFVGGARVSEDTADRILAKAIQIIRERKEEIEVLIAEYKRYTKAAA